MSGYDDGPARPRTGGGDTTTGTATSRARQARRAIRRQARARLALSGASGSGKTWTALCVAVELVGDGPIVLIDTEPADATQHAAELYADAFRFDTIQWEPPFDPRDLALTLDELGVSLAPDGYWAGRHGGYEAIIIDSGSHFWRGPGGTLDIADGRFGGWKTATPAQDRMVEAMLLSPAHVICCTRAKQDYAVSEKDVNGRTQQVVTKLGLAPIQRDDLEYEFQVVVMLDQDHRLDVGKTRAAPLAGKSYLAGQQFTFAQQYGEWLNQGVVLARQGDVDAIRLAVLAIEPREARIEAARVFKAEVAEPNYLLEADLPRAWAWVQARRGIAPHPFEPNPDSTLGACRVCSTTAVAPWHPAGPPSGPEPEPEAAQAPATGPTEAPQQTITWGSGAAIARDAEAAEAVRQVAPEAPGEPEPGDGGADPAEGQEGVPTGPPADADAEHPDDDEGDEPGPPDDVAEAERRARIEAWASTLSPMAAVAVLRDFGRSPRGTPNELRRRVVRWAIRKDGFEPPT